MRKVYKEEEEEEEEKKNQEEDLIPSCLFFSFHIISLHFTTSSLYQNDSSTK